MLQGGHQKKGASCSFLQIAESRESAILFLYSLVNPYYFITAVSEVSKCI